METAQDLPAWRGRPLPPKALRSRYLRIGNRKRKWGANLYSSPLINFEGQTLQNKKTFKFPMFDNVLNTAEKLGLPPHSGWPNHLDFNFHFYKPSRQSTLSQEEQDRRHETLQLPVGVCCLTNFSQRNHDFGHLAAYLGFHSRQAFATFFYTYGAQILSKYARLSRSTDSANRWTLERYDEIPESASELTDWEMECSSYETLEKESIPKHIDILRYLTQHWKSRWVEDFGTIRVEEVGLTRSSPAKKERKEQMQKVGKNLEIMLRKPSAVDTQLDDQFAVGTRSGGNTFSITRWSITTALDSKMVILMRTLSSLASIVNQLLNKDGDDNDKNPSIRIKNEPSLADLGIQDGNQPAIFPNREHLLLFRYYTLEFPFAFYMLMTSQDSNWIPPKDRHAIIHYMAADAPMVTRALELALRYVLREKKRLVVFTADPWGTAYMHAFFLVCGFRALAVDGSRSPLQRRQIINDWNDPTKNVQILVTSLAVSTAGIDLHRCCSTAIFMCLHYNAANLDHAMGRLIRIGQTEPVEIIILKTTGTFMDYQEKSMLDKYVPIRASEMQHSIPFTGIAFIMFCYEVVRECWGQSFNRFAWTLLDDREPEELVPEPEYFNAPITILVGHLISDVVRYLLRLKPGSLSRFERKLYFAGPVLRREAEKMLEKKGLTGLEDDVMSHFEDIEQFERNWYVLFERATNEPSRREIIQQAEESARQVEEGFTRRMAEGSEDDEGEDKGEDEEAGEAVESCGADEEGQEDEVHYDENKGNPDEDEDEDEDDGSGEGEGDQEG